jgi:hypothetical protein
MSNVGAMLQGNDRLIAFLCDRIATRAILGLTRTYMTEFNDFGARCTERMRPIVTFSL